MQRFISVFPRAMMVHRLQSRVIQSGSVNKKKLVRHCCVGIVLSNRTYHRSITLFFSLSSRRLATDKGNWNSWDSKSIQNKSALFRPLVYVRHPTCCWYKTDTTAYSVRDGALSKPIFPSIGKNSPSLHRHPSWAWSFASLVCAATRSAKGEVNPLLYASTNFILIGVDTWSGSSITTTHHVNFMCKQKQVWWCCFHRKVFYQPTPTSSADIPVSENKTNAPLHNDCNVIPAKMCPGEFSRGVGVSDDPAEQHRK